MISANKLLRGTMLLSVGQIVSYGLSVVRNIILARILTKTDFGLAAMFGMTISLLEVAGRMSLGQQIIQAKAGDCRLFQGTSHAFQFVLASTGSLLVLVLSQPLAEAFKVPAIGWAFALLALVPLARGLEHLDYFRLQRELNFLPAVLCEVIPQTVVTIAVWPLAIWLRDFRVIVWIMICRVSLGMVMTHCLARKPYEWAWNRDYLKGMWKFGWPLLITGILIFASQQADQVVVGSFLSLAKLAPYALAFSLVSIPWFIFGQVGTSIMLPILSREQDDPEQFLKRYRACLEYAAFGGVVLILPLIVAGEQFVTLLYGSKYAGTGLLMALLGATSAVRFLRFVPAVAAMARADTMNQLYSNLGRGISLPLAIVVAMLGGGAASIAVCALAAEIVAATVSVGRLRRNQGVPLQATAGAAAYVLTFVAGGLTVVFFGASRWGYWSATGALTAALVLSVFIGLAVFPHVSRTVRDAMERKTIFGIGQPAAN